MEITEKQRLLKIAVKGGYWNVVDQIVEGWDLGDYADHLINLYYPDPPGGILTAAETQQEINAAHEGRLA